MNHDFDSNDPLWKLLDRASPVEPGPFFARNALRRVRSHRSDSPSWILRWATRLAFATLVVGFLLALPSRQGPDTWDSARGVDSPFSNGETSVVAAEVRPFFDAAAGLDDLVTSGDTFF